MYRGRHRSVAIANALYKDLLCKNFHVTLEHRDINEDINREIENYDDEKNA